MKKVNMLSVQSRKYEGTTKHYRTIVMFETSEELTQSDIQHINTTITTQLDNIDWNKEIKNAQEY